jgi:hypothetical protein
MPEDDFINPREATSRLETGIGYPYPNLHKEMNQNEFAKNGWNKIKLQKTSSNLLKISDIYMSFSIISI